MTEPSPKKRARVEQMDLMSMKQKNISQGAVSNTLKRIRKDDFECNLRSKKRSGRLLKVSTRTARIKWIVQDDPIVSSVDIVMK